VVKHEAAEHCVVAGRLNPVPHVELTELHIGEPSLRRGVAGQVELDLVHVDANDGSGRRYEPGHLERHVAATATDIDAPHPRRQARAC